MSITLEQLDALLIEASALANYNELARAADEQPMWWLAVDDAQSVIAEWNDASQ